MIRIKVTDKTTMKKINNDKAIDFLLIKIWESEFEIIDGLNQHRLGLSFEEWLDNESLLEYRKLK